MDILEEQIKAIEEANPTEAAELEPGEGEQPKDDAPGDPDGKPDDPPEGDTGDDGEDAPVEDDAADDAPTDDDKSDDDAPKPRKPRSKPADKRIGELTAQLREAERKLQAQAEPDDTPAEPPARPNAEDFEYGESDPKYIEALTDFKVEAKDHERKLDDAERSKQDQAEQSRQQMFNNLANNVQKAEVEGKAKYDDFDTKVDEAIAARGGESLPPMITVGIGTSPVGADIIYRLATDDAASDRLEALAEQNNPQALAMAMGELEAEYLEDVDDTDLDPSDQLDNVRMMGRMRARMRGAKPAKKVEVDPTNAPEPPKQRARGGAGRSEVSPDTDDMQAFMKKYGGQMGT